jgi:hypothetical protein
MLKRFAVILVVLLVAGLIYSCGTSGGGPTGTVQGNVYAADGVTPIAGATVYATEASAAGASASTVPPSSLSETTTDSTGKFSLSVPTEGGSRTVDITIQKGVLKLVLTNVGVNEGATTATGDSDGKLYADPNKNQPGVTVTIGAMAVVTGSYDNMEDVLAKLGYGTPDAWGELVLGTEQFDMYDGNLTLPATYPDFDTLVSSPGAMSQYDIIFINCGNSYETLLSNSTVVDNLRNYVAAGGSLFVTDLSYDFVEQVFPEYIDFYGSDLAATSTPEAMGDAEVGTAGITVDATVLDNDLKSWLQGLGVLNADGTVHISGFLGGWAVMNDTSSSAAKKWVEGSVTFSGAGVSAAGHTSSQALSIKAFTTGVKPLTVSFDHGDNGGRVLYSSYHTEDDPDPSLRPQEYILAYLVFEL